MKYVKLHYPQGIFTGATILTGVLTVAALIVVFSSRIIRSAAAHKPETATSSAPRRSGEIDPAAHYGKLPLSFEANEGQADPQVKFLARGQGYDLVLTTTEAIIVLRNTESAKSGSHASASRPSTPAEPRSVLRLRLLGANRQPTVAAESELPGKVNYLIGNNPTKWRSDISTYSRVLYAEVYPHIDLAYYGNQQRIEYDFIVAPDAHPGRIRMFFSGARKVAVDKSGDLILSTDAGDMQLRKPLAYQEINGQRHSVNARYHLQGRHVGFELGQYDRRHPLVIDPVLSYASYLGGTFNDQAYDIAVDSVGNAYVTGSTYATDFPITPGALQTSTVGIGNDLGGGGFAQTDVFITKFNAAGNAVIYSTYLGGTDSTDPSLFFVMPARGNDEARGIAVDSDGQAYITGTTTSNNDFPVTPNAIQTAIAPNATSTEDVFITKLNATGDALIYSTRLGGSASDTAFAIAIDTGRNAYVTGYTQSTNFPTTPGAFRTSGGGVFVSKLNATGSGLLYSTLIGPGIPHDMVLDAQGNAYVTGETSVATFPTTAGAFQTVAPDGGSFINAFVTKVNAAGDNLVYSTYLGGRLNDFGYGIAIDSDGNAYVAGGSESNNFPITPGAFRLTGPGSFVTKLNPSGSGLIYSTFIGPSISDIALTASREAYLIGNTGSGLPTTPDASQPSYGGGGSDAFVMKLNASGSAITYSTYLGGGDAENGRCIALDSNGSAYVAGWTQSTNFPVSAGVFQITPSGNYFDIGSFVAKFSETTTTTFRISGRLTDSNGNGLGGVPVRLGGALDGIQWSVAGGNFSFGNLPAGGSYTVTPLNQRFNFTVASQSFDNLTSNQTANFTGTARNQVFFSANSYRAYERVVRVPITVNRTGDTSGAASVGYFTSDVTASERRDYITAIGTLRFAVGETSKTFDVFLTDDSFPEAHETFTVTLKNATGGLELGSPDAATVTIISDDASSPFNPADSTGFFVRQHYIDFLNRLPDQAGQNFWTNEITSCGSDQHCIEIKRINVSAAFFLSIEFQQTGYLVERLYKAAYGDATGTSTSGGTHQLAVPIVRFTEFLPDTQQIGQGVVVGQTGWETVLENNRQNFTAQFVQRSRFITAFPTSMIPAQFVDKLNTNASNVLSSTERATAIAQFGSATDTSNITARAQALRQVAENQTLYNAEFNRAFVLMQYLGYLRRNPNDAPDTDYTGYDFWLTKLNQFNGNFVAAEMVKAFITSSEYRQRFGP